MPSRLALFTMTLTDLQGYFTYCKLPKCNFS